MWTIRQAKRNSLHLTLWLSCLYIVWAHSSCAAELLTNGGFESPLSSEWITHVDYGTLAEQSGNVSPFTNIYGPSTSALEMTSGGDPVTHGYGPGINQSLGAVSSSQFTFSFEFSISNVPSGSAWEIGVGGNTAVIDFLIGWDSQIYFGADYSHYTSLATLSSSSWYQVSAFIDLKALTFAGNLTEFNGGIVPFSGSIVPGGHPYITVLAGYTDYFQGSTLYLDNVSLKSVPEPQPAVFVCAIAGLFLLQRRCQSVAHS